jgi:hypothetical protein
VAYQVRPCSAGASVLVARGASEWMPLLVHAVNAFVLHPYTRFGVTGVVLYGLTVHVCDLHDKLNEMN